MRSHHADTHTYKADAIVLRRRNLGETDKILVLFTQWRGKISVVAKGSRKPQSRLTGAAETLNYLKGQVSTGRNLDILTQCEVKESFPRLRENLTALTTALYLTELTDSMTEEDQQYPDIFHLLLSSLYILDRGKALPNLVARRFEIQLMALIGYEPRLDECVRCGADVEEGSLGFSAQMGGVLCSQCLGRVPDSVALSRQALIALSILLEMEPERLETARTKPELARELKNRLHDYIRNHLGSRIRSLDFLNELSDSDSLVNNK